VTVMTLGLLLVLLVPLAFAIAAIAQNADRMVGWANSLAGYSVPRRRTGGEPSVFRTDARDPVEADVGARDGGITRASHRTRAPS